MSKNKTRWYKPVRIGLRKTTIYIGDTKVKFYNDRKTYKEYLADRFNPNINDGKHFLELHKYVKNYVSFEGIPLFANLEAETSKIEFPEIWRTKKSTITGLGREVFPKNVVYLKYSTEKRYLQLKKIHKPELPVDYKFPKHLGCNDHLYKDLKEYHPDESRKEKRLRIRSYAKKRREENNIYITKEYGSIIAGIISLSISLSITLFDAIKTIIVLAFKLPFFPFWLLGLFYWKYLREVTDELDLKYQNELGYFFIATLGIILVGGSVGIVFATLEILSYL
tara:strand:- start:44 stop:883 length:840 start_codon:yes stop_codon:yes gene_type:complete